MDKTKIIKIVLLIAIIGLSYMIVKGIADPIEFEEEKDKRYSAVVQTLKDIRTAEIAYKDMYGMFTGDFNNLINFVKNDSMRIVKITSKIVDDTTTIQLRDTSFQPVITSIFHDGYTVDSMIYIPFSNYKKFRLEAGEIKRVELWCRFFKLLAVMKTSFMD